MRLSENIPAIIAVISNSMLYMNYLQVYARLSNVRLFLFALRGINLYPVR